MRVIEIFKSIDGEGIRTGYPVTFIRLEGCNLRCSYCDTKYAYIDSAYTEMTPDEIVKQVCRLGCMRVTLTGGEPLIHEDVTLLVDSLLRAGFEVNIETNGSVDIEPYVHGAKTIVTMDYKCPSSGMEESMLFDNIRLLRKRDVLKFVVGSVEDLDRCRDLVKYTNANVFISPVFGKIEPKQIVEYILEHDMQTCRVQVQLHKILWAPDQRGV